MVGVLNVISVLLGGGGISFLIMNFVAGALLSFILMGIIELFLSAKEG